MAPTTAMTPSAGPSSSMSTTTAASSRLRVTPDPSERRFTEMASAAAVMPSSANSDGLHASAPGSTTSTTAATAAIPARNQSTT